MLARIPPTVFIALKQAQALQLGFQHKAAVQVFACGFEDHVHFGACIRMDIVDVKTAAAIYRLIQGVRLLFD